MLPLRQIYSWLATEYANLRGDNNPTKAGIQLAYDRTGKSPTSFINVLVSRISNGYYGTKTIMCDMAGGRTVSQTTLFNPGNDIVAVLDSAALTSTRCALMACLAADYFFDGDLSNKKIGLIGAGHINLKTAAALHDIFGVKEFLYKTRSGKLRVDLSNLSPNILFKRADSFSDFSDCDAIFVATTETSKEAQASLGDFCPSKSRVLWVTQDTGCLLDQSFRLAVASFTDDVASLKSHWFECFPWDRFREPDLRPLHALKRHEGSAAVYLYGMGFSDIVMACASLDIAQ